MRYASLWIIAGILGAGLLALWIYFSLRGQRFEANRTLARLIDTWTAPRAHAARTKLEKLKERVGSDKQSVAAAEAEVAAIRRALRVKYRELSLTPEEIEDRLKDLRV